MHFNIIRFFCHLYLCILYFSLHRPHFDGRDKNNLYNKNKKSHIGNEVFSGFLFAASGLTRSFVICDSQMISLQSEEMNVAYSCSFQSQQLQKITHPLRLLVICVHLLLCNSNYFTADLRDIVYFFLLTRGQCKVITS